MRALCPRQSSLLSLVSLPLLVACSKPASVDPAIADEIARREEYSKAVLVDGGGIEANKVRPTTDVQYVDGISIVVFEPRDHLRGHAYRWMGEKSHVRLKMHGQDTMRLRLVGWVDEKVLHFKPRMQLYVNGESIEPIEPTGKVDEHQFFFYEADLEPKIAHGREWIDVDIVWNGVAWHWLDPPDLRVIVLSDLAWGVSPNPKK